MHQMEAKGNRRAGVVNRLRADGRTRFDALVDGVPVDVPDVKTRITFQIED